MIATPLLSKQRRGGLSKQRNGEVILQKENKMDSVVLLSEDDLQAIESSAIPTSATKATMKKIKTWCNKRGMNINFGTVNPAELNNALRQFYAEIRAINGNRLSPSSLVGIRAAINRHVQGAPLYRNEINDVAGIEFLSANKMFEAVL